MNVKKSEKCLNCDNKLLGNENYCPNCSKKNDINKYNILEIINEFFSGFFSFNTLYLRTFKALLKPGFVIKEFLSGKTKKYTNPFVFLLHSTIIYFILMNVLDKCSPNYKINLLKEENIKIINNKVDSLFIQEQNIIFIKDTFNTIYQKEKFFQNFYKNDILKSLKYENKTTKLVDKIYFNNLNFYINNKLSLLHFNYMVEYINNDSVMLNKTILNINDSLSLVQKINNYTAINKDVDVNIAYKKLEKSPNLLNKTIFYIVYKQLTKGNDKSKQELIQNELNNNITLALFIFSPIFALFISFLYMRHKFSYTEHLVFLFYQISVVLWLLIICKILMLIIGGGIIIELLTLTIYLIYLTLSLKYFYLQSWKKTILKILLFVPSFIIFLIISMILYYIIIVSIN